MSRIIVALLAVGLGLVSSPASAYVWRCHTPNGDVWTEQPPQYGDCEEYDGTFNRNAAPPSAQYRQPQYAAPSAPVLMPSNPVQYAPPPPPGYGYPYSYASPYPYAGPAFYPYPYYSTFYGYYGTVFPVVYSPGYLKEEKKIRIETNFYSTVGPDGELVWTGMSDTFNPSSTKKAIDSVVKLVVKELEKQQLLGSATASMALPATNIP